MSLCLFVDAEYCSPYAMSAFVALHEKDLPFELATVSLGNAENQAAGYANLSLTRRVPMLIHEEFALSESSAIAEYVDEMFPGVALYPEEPRAKARARQVQAWLRSDLMPIRQERSTDVVFYGTRKPPLSSEAREAAEKLFAAADALLPDGAENLFWEWSIVDVDLALMLMRLVAQGDAVPDRLAVYASRQWRRATVQLWVNQLRPLL